MEYTTNYYHGDHLGSARLMSGYNGYPVWQATYLPFGQEHNPQITVNRYKFTSKERDSETGLDYFGARYLGSTLGRFTSPDSTSYSSLRFPQSWNLYAYTLNNPLSFIDPDGHAVECKTEPEKCLEAAKAAPASKEAASRLYLDRKTEKAGWLRRTFLRQQTVTRNFIGMQGDVGSFKQLGTNASRMADLAGVYKIREWFCEEQHWSQAAPSR